MYDDTKILLPLDSYSSKISEVSISHMQVLHETCNLKLVTGYFPSLFNFSLGNNCFLSNFRIKYWGVIFTMFFLLVSPKEKTKWGSWFILFCFFEHEWQRAIAHTQTKVQRFWKRFFQRMLMKENLKIFPPFYLECPLYIQQPTETSEVFFTFLNSISIAQALLYQRLKIISRKL